MTFLSTLKTNKLSENFDYNEIDTYSGNMDNEVEVKKYSVNENAVVFNEKFISSFSKKSNIGIILLSIMGLLAILSTLPIQVHGQRNSFFNMQRRELSPYKGYSGIRVRPDSLRMAYIHDQTVAVVEIGENREIWNCELIEIYKPSQGLELQKNLTSLIGIPVKISFEQMMELMDNCMLLDAPKLQSDDYNNFNQDSGKPARGFAASPSTIFSGIIPGTKWCGSGDLAETFFDLGKEAELDKCCRNHDICPSKVRPNTTRFNLTNSAIFTKSHCTCDLKFMQCLKRTKNPTADIMGNFYFNILRVPCLNITGHRFQTAYRY